MRSIQLMVTALLLAGTALAQDVAFQGVRVFDGTGVIPETTVVVEDGLITQIGPDSSIPEGVAVVDGEGLTLLPGLIDSHVHTFYREALQQELVFGVTTVLDMFTDPSLAAGLRAEQEAGPLTDRAGFLSSGPLATAPGGHGTQFGISVPTLTSPDQAEQWVLDRVAEGADYIKVILESGEELGMPQPTLDEETLRAVVSAAHGQGMLVITHVQTLEMARLALDAGTDGLAHIMVDAVADTAFVQQAVDSGLFVIPTLTVFQSIGAGEPVDQSISGDEFLAPFLSAADLQSLASPYTGFAGLSREYGFENVRLLYEAGVPLLAGTDAMNPGTAYGASMHRELELLTVSSLTPLDALAAATSVPARVFGLEGRGVIEVGAHADLLLVAGDPTRDITATRDIRGVWKNGVEADRDAWRNMISAQQGAAAAAADALAQGDSALISDFESGDAQVSFGQPWEATTDALAGGDSTAGIEVVAGGAGGSDHALQVSGEVGTAFALPWGGAMFMPGEIPFAPADLSAKPVLRFSAAGEPAGYRVQLFCVNSPQVPGEWAFSVTQEWQDHEVDLGSIGGCDTSGVMAIIFSSGTPGEFRFTLDDVTLERAGLQ
jgi:imidazolonepropionase-like amidohydrolase